MLLLLGFVVSLRVNAQEVIDIAPEAAIPVEPVPELEQPVPEQAPLISEEPVAVIEKPIEESAALEVGPVDITLDDKRLDIMAFQALSFESTGEYTQIKNAEVVEGDVIGFEASMVGVVEPTEEIHVYEAPCGKGWQLIIYEDNVVRRLSSTTKMFEDQVERTVRSYGYGCEHDSRTFNW